MSEKKGNYGFLAILALLFIAARKKGIGTTLFGVGTQLDLTKPIEDVNAFIKASQEETARGFTGSIKPKGIYYQIKAGDQLARKLDIDKKNSTCSPAEIAAAQQIEFYTAPYDLKIYNPQLQYVEDQSQVLPPFVTWPGAEELIIKQNCSILGKAINITNGRADYSRFQKTV